jgi:hypothetical protein
MIKMRKEIKELIERRKILQEIGYERVPFSNIIAGKNNKMRGTFVVIHNPRVHNAISKLLNFSCLDHENYIMGVYAYLNKTKRFKKIDTRAGFKVSDCEFYIK